MFGWGGKIIGWLWEKLTFGDDPYTRPLSATGAVVRATLLILVAALVVAVIMLTYQRWQGSRPAHAEAIALSVAPPDLTDESTSADELPEDGWLALGRSLAEQGDFRLAMRAFFLGALAALADQRMIRIAKHKSNRDYALELSRQGGRSPGIVPTFREGVTQFEAVWYGSHVIGGDQLNDFAQKLRGLRSHDG